MEEKQTLLDLLKKKNTSHLIISINIVLSDNDFKDKENWNMYSTEHDSMIQTYYFK